MTDRQLISVVLAPFEEWATRVADILDVFELREEGRALDRDRAALLEEIAELRVETTRETRVENWRLRRLLRRRTEREHRRKKRALDRYAQVVATEAVEELTTEERRKVLLEAA